MRGNRQDYVRLGDFVIDLAQVAMKMLNIGLDLTDATQSNL